MRQFIAGLLTAWLLLAVLPAEAAGAMRCGSRLVAEGDRAADLIATCGEPAYRDVRSWRQPNGNTLADVEEWYYNFGPSQLLRVVRLRNGRIVSIDADGYGYYESPRRNCDTTALVPGLSKFRLLEMCGEPLTRRSVQVLRQLDDGWRRYPPGYGDHYEAVHREEWVYNFGSSNLMRILTIEDGRIVDVESGSRGFD